MTTSVSTEGDSSRRTTPLLLQSCARKEPYLHAHTLLQEVYTCTCAHTCTHTRTHCHPTVPVLLGTPDWSRPPPSHADCHGLADRGHTPPTQEGGDALPRTTCSSTEYDEHQSKCKQFISTMLHHIVCVCVCACVCVSGDWCAYPSTHRSRHLSMKSEQHTKYSPATPASTTPSVAAGQE